MTATSQATRVRRRGSSWVRRRTAVYPVTHTQPPRQVPQRRSRLGCAGTGARNSPYLICAYVCPSIEPFHGYWWTASGSCAPPPARRFAYGASSAYYRG